MRHRTRQERCWGGLLLAGGARRTGRITWSAGGGCASLLRRFGGRATDRGQHLPNGSRIGALARRRTVVGQGYHGKTGRRRRMRHQMSQTGSQRRRQMRRSSSRSRSTTSRGSTSSSSSTTTASGLQLDGFCPQASPPTPSAARALPRGQSVYSTPFFSFGTLQLSPLSQLRSAFRTVPQRSFSFQDRHCGATTPVPEKGRHSSLLSPK